MPQGIETCATSNERRIVRWGPYASQLATLSPGTERTPRTSKGIQGIGRCTHGSAVSVAGKRRTTLQVCEPPALHAPPLPRTSNSPWEIGT